jgi:hypothetical protein
MDTSLVSAVVAAATALVVAVVTNHLSRVREREADWRRLKLDRYRELVAALSGVVEGRSSAVSHRRYADAINELQLVAPANVLSALENFLAHTSYRNPERSQEQHDALFSALIRAIRRDLMPKERASISRHDFWLQALPPSLEEPTPPRRPACQPPANQSTSEGQGVPTSPPAVG